MDPRNVRSWAIGTAILSPMTVLVSLTTRNRLVDVPGIETTFTWAITSWYGIIAQICIVATMLFVLIAIIDAL